MIPIEVYQDHPGTTETVMYTVPAGQRLIVTEIVLSNVDTVPRRATVHLRRGGAAPASRNRTVPNVLVGAESVVVFTLRTVLAAGGIISGSISAASTIAVTISGIQEAI